MAASKVEQVTDCDYEPWYYCATCLSPSIEHEDITDTDCCRTCGSTQIEESTFEEWEAKYERKYGHKYTKKEEDPKKSFVFSMPLEKLKTRVYENSAWRDIIKMMYPKFPGGLGRVDSIILFFDTIIKQGRLDELKLNLYRFFKY